MNKDQAIALATALAGGQVDVGEDEGEGIMVYPLDKEGEVIYECPVEVLNSGDVWIVVDSTGGGRGDVQRVIYLDENTKFESMT